jgi:hypothetical protein
MNVSNGFSLTSVAASLNILCESNVIWKAEYTQLWRVLIYFNISDFLNFWVHFYSMVTFIKILQECSAQCK